MGAVFIFQLIPNNKIKLISCDRPNYRSFIGGKTETETVFRFGGLVPSFH